MVHRRIGPFTKLCMRAVVEIGRMRDLGCGESTTCFRNSCLLGSGVEMNITVRDLGHGTDATWY